MLTLTRQSQVDKAKETFRDVVSYADEIIRDEKLRGDIRAAIGHGTEASDRLRADIDSGGLTSRLVSDKKLRRKVRATLDDLESAGERLRHRRRHRIRNFLLIAAAATGVVALVVRHRLAHSDWQPAGEADGAA